MAKPKDTESKIITELTPELADKIWKSIQKRRYDEKVSKDTVLHHLNQLKAQMGKYRKTLRNAGDAWNAVHKCMEIIDKKIKKINS